MMDAERLKTTHYLVLKFASNEGRIPDSVPPETIIQLVRMGLVSKGTITDAGRAAIADRSRYEYRPA